MSEYFWQQVVSGIITGGIFAAFAVGLTATFGIIHIINFAHGGFVLLGAYMAVACVDAGMPFGVAVLLSFLTIYVLASIIERGLFRPTLATPLNGLILSVGLLAVMQNTVLRVFGTRLRSIDPFTYEVFSIGGIDIPIQRAIVGGVGVVAVLAYWFAVNRTKFGLDTRIVAEDRDMARLLGVNVGRIVNVNFAVGAGIAAITGAFLATIQPITAFSAEGPTLIAFVVIIVGSLGSIPGVLVAGILMAVVTNLGIAYLDPSYSLAYQFGLVVLVLLIKPDGLLGRGLGAPGSASGQAVRP